jgi:hypothetical protein
VAYEDLTAGLRERLGVTDAAASDEALLAALDESRGAQPHQQRPPPEGTTLIDSDGPREACSRTPLRAVRPERSRSAHAATASSTTAVREGRISPASRADLA